MIRDREVRKSNKCQHTNCHGLGSLEFSEYKVPDDDFYAEAFSKHITYLVSELNPECRTQGKKPRYW